MRGLYAFVSGLLAARQNSHNVPVPLTKTVYKTEIRDGMVFRYRIANLLLLFQNAYKYYDEDRK